MTTRVPVSSIENKWVDAQRVDLSDLNTEQSHNNSNAAAIVQNFMGSGVLLENPTPTILFDTDNLSAIQAQLQAANNLDGTGLEPAVQPTDILQGNQLAVEYTDSSIDQTTRASLAKAFGRWCSKVLIIGLDFEGNLIYDRFEFHKRETQTTNNHYARILTIILNNFDGNNNCSASLGGRIIVREAKPFELNRDAIMIKQDVEPNIFIRDIRPADCHKSIYTMIQDGIGSAYDADDLEINITGRQPRRSIDPADVTTRIGQKFLANTNNLQKVTLLLGVSRDDDATIEHRFDWTGDLVISIYRLQTTTSCPTDIIPDLSIDFEPEETPVAELSFSQAELRDAGYVLTDAPQPVDFVFTNSAIAESGGMEIGRYYALTVRRSGDPDTGTIYLEVGNHRTDYSRLTVFNGLWVDVQEEDLWFQAWSDTAKVATGQAYDSGNGIFLPKVSTDALTGAAIDNYERYLNLVSTGVAINNIAVVQSVSDETKTVQDERTGNNVYSRKQNVPSVSFVTDATLTTLRQTSEPLIIGCLADVNPKARNLIEKTQEYIGCANGDVYTIINPDADLLSLRLIGRKLIPQTTCATYEYRIFKANYCVDGYGDVNGDGYISQLDVTRAAELRGSSLSDLTTQNEILAGTKTTLEILRADVDGDGIVSATDVALIQSFVNKEINTFPVGTYFTHLDLQVQPAVARWDGYWTCWHLEEPVTFESDGYIKTDPDALCPSSVDPFTLTDEERIYFGNPIVPSIDGDNPAVYQVSPFVPVNYQISYVPFWQDWLLSLSADARELPATFTYPTSIEVSDCSATPNMFTCQQLGDEIPEVDPGRNDFYVPGNLILGSGDVIRPNGTPVAADVEVGVINLELGSNIYSETSFNILRDFVADKGDGFTNANYPAMRYSDCSNVVVTDLDENRIRFNVSIQSFVPNLDGYSSIDGYGIIVDDVIGVFMDHTTGILSLTIQDLDENPLYRTLVTKIQIVVYLKKSGWNNQVLTITSDELAGLVV